MPAHRLSLRPLSWLLLFSLQGLFLLTAQAGGPLKIVSWNLEWFPGHRMNASSAEAEAHMAAAKRELARIDPDVFIGIEMRDWAAFQELVSAVQGLRPHVVSVFRDLQTGEVRPQQIGIASKLTVNSAWTETWKANIPNVPRGFSFAALEMPDGVGLLMVYGNHFKSNRPGNDGTGAEGVAVIRAEQTKQLSAHVAAMQKAFAPLKIYGWIAAGDFNTNQDNQFPGCRVVQTLTSEGWRNTWAETPREQRLTWRGDRYKRYAPTTFDYVFTLGLGNPTAKIVESPRDVSDHYPIAITLE